MDHTGEENPNIVEKCESDPSNPESDPSNPIRKNKKRSKPEVDRGNSGTDSGDSDGGWASVDSDTQKNIRSKPEVDIGNSDTDSGDSYGGWVSVDSDTQKNIKTKMNQIELNFENNPNQPEISEGEGSNCSSDGNFFSMKRCRDAFCRMIIMDKLPFRTVECEGIREFFHSLQPKLIMPSRKTVVRDCFRIYLEEMRKLKRVLVEKEQRVCLTTETWTSMQTLDYMVLTAHFIDDDWKVQKRILNFSLIPDHKEDTIGTTIEKCLLDWGIEKVFTVTLDNASYSDGAVAYLMEKIRNQSGVVLNGDFVHIVNLMACDALKELQGSTIKIRSVIEYVKSSLKVLENFENFARDEEISCKNPLCLDVPTRWDSTYTMLDTALKFQKAFEMLESKDKEFCLKFIENEERKVPPLREDWDNVRAFLGLLKFFHSVTLRVSGSSSCATSQRFFHEIFLIKTKIEKCSKSDNSLLANTARNMKVKYETFVEDSERTNFLWYIPIVLDPRYKLKFVSFSLSRYEVERSNEIRKKVEDMTRSLYNEYQNANVEREASCNSMDQLSVRDLGEEDDEDDNVEFTKYLMQHDVGCEKSELDRYLYEPCESWDNTFNILDWWRRKSPSYKILGKMAKDIFAIPLSTNVLESSFSTGDRILDLYHSSLPPKTAEIVICLRNWLCPQTDINTDETTDEIRFEDFDFEDEENQSTDMELETEQLVSEVLV